MEYPVECDDEYWEPADPEMAFKQPPGRPSVVSYIIAYFKLLEILGMAQQKIVSSPLFFLLRLHSLFTVSGQAQGKAGRMDPRCRS